MEITSRGPLINSFFWWHLCRYWTKWKSVLVNKNRTKSKYSAVDRQKINKKRKAPRHFSSCITRRSAPTTFYFYFAALAISCFCIRKLLAFQEQKHGFLSDSIFSVACRRHNFSSRTLQRSLCCYWCKEFLRFFWVLTYPQFRPPIRFAWTTRATPAAPLLTM